jgi:hypothetical protein
VGAGNTREHRGGFANGAVAALLMDLEEVRLVAVEVADALKASLPGTLKNPRGGTARMAELPIGDAENDRRRAGLRTGPQSLSGVGFA